MAPIIHRIIVIDHRPILREGIVAVLTSALPGFEIMGAEDFTAALDRISMTPIALAITDFQVKGDTALTFLQHVKDTNHPTRCLGACQKSQDCAQSCFSLFGLDNV